MKLTEIQKKKLEKHKEHHTKKHIDMMKKLMMDGMSFTSAHKETQKKIGN